MTQATLNRIQVRVRGAVQGVGFRPFVYRLATELGLTGCVSNTTEGVIIDVEGAEERLQTFVARFVADKPAPAIIEQLDWQPLDPVGYSRFEIRHSATAGAKTALILPDLAICPECLREILDPANRRYRYPFTNCTHCGPRFTIIEALPYDRPNTTMKRFPMCPACQAEYDDPLDRRFHAQPNACPVCGPQLAFWDASGHVQAVRDDALMLAVEALRRGKIVAVKGLGGFHLMCDARDQDAVMTLRRRKAREEKPFALLYPSLAQVEAHCHVSALERDLLLSPEAPIVLLERRGGPDVAPAVAPDNPYLGIMLPATPLHHLLLAELGFPVVATSGNRSGEPICVDEREALERLGSIADCFLVHDRPIARHADDSIVRVAAGQAQILRRARGYAPLPVELPAEAPVIVATGAHLKNTTAISAGRRVFLSQHIGDLDTPEARAALKRAAADFQQMYALQPQAVACDLHPDYASTRIAESLGLPLTRVQHHEAHVLACMAEHGINAPALGVSWDGTGYGTDGTIWGGEFFHLSATSVTRLAHLATFRLPGGEAAIKDPRRTALALLYHALDEAAFDADLPVVRSLAPGERRVLARMLRDGLNAPLTSSMGRLFDGFAALVGIRDRCGYEGQPAMALEFAAQGQRTDECYPFTMTADTTDHAPTGWIIEWKPVVESVLGDMGSGVPKGAIAAKLHNTMAAMVVAVARLAGECQVVLSGGCFQNRRLLERTVQLLTENGFHVYWPQRVPTNDGGIALGQIVGAMRERAPSCAWPYPEKS